MIHFYFLALLSLGSTSPLPKYSIDNRFELDLNLDPLFLGQLSTSIAGMLQESPINIDIDKIQEIVHVPVLGDIGTRDLQVKLSEMKSCVLVPETSQLKFNMTGAQFKMEGDLLIAGFNTMRFQMQGTFNGTFTAKMNKTQVRMDKPQFYFSKLKPLVIKPFAGGPAVSAIMNGLIYLFENQIRNIFERIVMFRLWQIIPGSLETLFSDLFEFRKTPYTDYLYNVAFTPKAITNEGLQLHLSIHTLKNNKKTSRISNIISFNDDDLNELNKYID